MTTIELDGLTKRFGDTVAVDHVSFTTKPGSITAFLGPNGAGKTTTLRMLLGLVAPAAGTATIDGHAYRDLTHPRQIVGAVLESSNPYPGRTTRQHLQIEALGADAPSRRIREMLQLVDLEGATNQRVGTFSLGMRQRLALATALLCDPPILISSHILAEVAQTVDRVVIMNHGRLIANADVDELIADHHGASLEDVFLDLTTDHAGARR